MRPGMRTNSSNELHETFWTQADKDGRRECSV